MATAKTTWILELIDRVGKPLQKVQTAVNATHDRVGKVQRRLNQLSAIDLQAVEQSTQRVKEGFQRFNDVAIRHESALAEVEAITGLTGDKLKALDKQARNISTTFGSSVEGSLSSFKVLLSKLGPEIGNNDKAMGSMGSTIQTLSKTMEGDVAGATDALTNSMLQFRVSLDDPIKAALEMNRMSNIMAAGAKEGSAEVIDLSAGLKQAGGTARLANVSFAETNSALQLLDKAGKKGAEGGVALRNVLLKMNAPSKVTRKAAAILAQYGVNMDVVANKSLPLAERLRELQKIGKNTDALNALFGSENVQGAEALINTADDQAELTKKIEGTNVAQEQAAIIMNTSAERARRWNARLDVMKISIGKYTKHLQPFVNVTADGISMLANMGNAMRGAKIMSDALRISLGLQKAQHVQAAVGAAVTAGGTTAMASAQGVATVTSYTLAGALRAIGLAIKSIPVVGWILALIGALIALTAHLWRTSGTFRGIIFGFWNIFKLVFGKVFSFGKRIFTGLWSGIQIAMAKIKAVIMPILSFLKFQFMYHFNNIYESVMWVIDGIVGALEKVTKWLGKLFPSAAKAFNKGLDKGRDQINKKKAKKEPAIENPFTAVTGGNTPSEGTPNGAASGLGGLSGGGSGGGKSISMTLNLYNTFQVMGSKLQNNMDELADQLAGRINDRLRDAVIALE